MTRRPFAQARGDVLRDVFHSKGNGHGTFTMDAYWMRVWTSVLVLSTPAL